MKTLKLIDKIFATLLSLEIIVATIIYFFFASWSTGACDYLNATGDYSINDPCVKIAINTGASRVPFYLALDLFFLTIVIYFLNRIWVVLKPRGIDNKIFFWLMVAETVLALNSYSHDVWGPSYCGPPSIMKPLGFLPSAGQNCKKYAVTFFRGGGFDILLWILLIIATIFVFVIYKIAKIHADNANLIKSKYKKNDH